MPWYTLPTKPPCEQSRRAAQLHQQQLTKPAGSLGKPEELVQTCAAWQGCEKPALERIDVRIFAADRGISQRSVSAFAPEVTVQMIGNCTSGGAAISVLCRDMDADFAVVNMATFSPVPVPRWV